MKKHLSEQFENLLEILNNLSEYCFIFEIFEFQAPPQDWN